MGGQLGGQGLGHGFVVHVEEGYWLVVLDLGPVFLLEDWAHPTG